jgi:hypothetical protein
MILYIREKEKLHHSLNSIYAKTPIFETVKRLFPIVMTVAFILPVWGSFYYLQVQKKLVQKKVKRQIMKSCNDEDLVFIAFTKEETQTLLNWKHSKEFEYNGEMYDIVHKRETQDSVYFKLWWDKEETVVNQKVKRIANSIFSQHEQQQEELAAVMLLKFLFYETNYEGEEGCFLGQNKPLANNFPLRNNWYAVQVPPPEENTSC